MEVDELVELAQSVASCLVRAKAMGADGVVATLQMALDELLEGLASAREVQVQVELNLEEESEL